MNALAYWLLESILSFPIVSLPAEWHNEFDLGSILGDEPAKKSEFFLSRHEGFCSP